MRFAFESTGQRRQVWRDKRYRLGGEAAERTLIAAMAGVLCGRFVVVDVNAQFRCVTKERLELGGDRRVIGAGESGRGQSRRRRGGEQLNDERQHDENGGQARAERRQTALCAPSPKRKSLAPEAHQHSLRCPYSVAEWTRERNFISGVDDAPAVAPSSPEI
jgi:hypothetical protein